MTENNVHVQDVEKAMTEKNEKFLADAEARARELAPAGLTFTANPMVLRDSASSCNRGIRMVFSDGRWFEVSAQAHAYRIERSDGFVRVEPWNANDDPLRHVRKALEGFFAQKKVQKK